MTDAPDQPEPRAPKELASARERARGEIRAELARQRPIEDARVALELIAESALRFPPDAGALGYRVVDENGATRVAIRDGAEADFTIRDLVADLRGKHPTLFKPTRPEAMDEPDTAEASAAPEQAAPRDWLIVKEGGPATTETVPASAKAAATPEGAASASPQWMDTARRGAATATAVMSGAFRRASLRGKVMLHRARVARSRARQEAKGAPASERGRRLPMGYAVAAAAAAVVLIVVGFVLGTALTSGGPKRDASRPAVASNAAPAPQATAPPQTASTPQAPQARPVTPSPAPEVRTVTPAPPPAAAPAPPPTPAPPPPAPEPAATASVPPATAARSVLAGVPEVIDTATLRIEGKVVRLFGVEWARGAQGDDLKGYIRGRAVRCTATGTADVHRCEVDGKDLSEVVLYNGGGRATPDASADLVTAENHAKTEKLGVWKK
jgi:endonuclease YncB( thermonuclease family)